MVPRLWLKAKGKISAWQGQVAVFSHLGKAGTVSRINSRNEEAVEMV